MIKNNLITIVLFLGAFIWFVIFAVDYTYHRDFMTWMHLLAFITWWTCGMVNFIIERTSSNDRNARRSFISKLPCLIGWHQYTCKIQDCIDEFGYVPSDGRMPKVAKCSRCGKNYA